MKRHVKNPITAKDFIKGLTRMKREDLRRKYEIPANLDPDLLTAVLRFMQKEERTRRTRSREAGEVAATGVSRGTLPLHGEAARHPFDSICNQTSQDSRRSRIANPKTDPNHPRRTDKPHTGPPHTENIFYA
jgi:hypothetical protein